ncbi:hypothetical protein [Oligoflexus tunisiensis]|uniref:hypothetical protein n=1 Tax=Oligoflexus tunisiensis TaxID=708132 RepID=UPI00114D3416|nr:hypothetical protein [Oligoflexus tunisiensis]
MWKRSKFVQWLLVLGCGPALVLPAFPWDSLHAVESTGHRLPNIRQVAIMPVYWQGRFPESHRFAQSKKHIEGHFSKIVRDSKRFVFSNDVLTADLWSTAEGRQQLAEEYEIDAMINLTVTGQGDTMRWTVRLLHPGMRNYLTETETLPFNWLLAATNADIDQRLQNLLFRMLNRFPVDVYVTSIQGRYLTLSSGSEQNIFEGDDLSFYQTMVRTQHPADGSWLTFDQKLLGKARVIESKTHSAIALITALSYSDAIRVGDGAKVAAIATRRAFQQKPKDEPFYTPLEPESPLVEARPLPRAVVPEPQSTEPPRVAENKVETPPPPPVQQAPLPPEPVPAPNPVIPEESEDEALDMLPIAFKKVEFQGQNETFAISGAAKSSSQFPIYLLNRVDLAATQDIASDVEAIARAHLRFGSTAKGSYFGLGLGFEPLYYMPMRTAVLPSLDRVMVGALISFESLAVSGEPLGGWDVISLSPAVHLQGSYHVVSMAQNFDYDLSGRLTPIDIGEVGVAGKKRKISDSFTLDLEANVIQKAKAQDWEWGAMLGYSTGTMNLSQGSINTSVLRLGVAGRMRL